MPGINSWFEDELRERFQADRNAVDESWRRVFEGKGGETVPEHAAPGSKAPPVISHAAPPPMNGDQLQPLRGAAGRIAENMAASLSIPLATSQRTIPVKLMDENRRLVNQHRGLSAGGKSPIPTSSAGPWSKRCRRCPRSMRPTWSRTARRSARRVPESIWALPWMSPGRMAPAPSWSPILRARTASPFRNSWTRSMGWCSARAPAG